MSFETFQDFVHMGGHGAYVWWSYAAGAAVLVLNLLRLSRDRRRTLEALKRSVLAEES